MNIIEMMFSYLNEEHMHKETKKACQDGPDRPCKPNRFEIKEVPYL